MCELLENKVRCIYWKQRRSALTRSTIKQETPMAGHAGSMVGCPF